MCIGVLERFRDTFSFVNQFRSGCRSLDSDYFAIEFIQTSQSHGSGRDKDGSGSNGCGGGPGNGKLIL